MAWFVNEGGFDSFGRPGTWAVERYKWVPDPATKRRDGLGQEREIAQRFVGDLYTPGDLDAKRNAAHELCRKLNAELPLELARDMLVCLGKPEYRGDPVLEHLKLRAERLINESSTENSDGREVLSRRVA